MKKSVHLILSMVMVFSVVLPKTAMPNAGVRLMPVSGMVVPVALKGLHLDPDEPFQFQFMIDAGVESVTSEAINTQAQRLAEFFLTALALPEEALWVNLAPQEGDRVMERALAETGAGRVMLEQDLMLKQLSASLMHPDLPSGQTIWERIYAEGYARTGRMDVDLDALHKIWIVPDVARVYEGHQTVFIVESRLKVQLGRHEGDAVMFDNEDAYTGLLTEVLLPIIEEEVNEGAYFAPLRQWYQALILAQWYKQHLRGAVMTQVYADQGRTGGVDTEEITLREEMYQQYMDAFKQGAVDVIREVYDPDQETMVPQRYFAGGLRFQGLRPTVLSDEGLISNEIKAASSYHLVGFDVAVLSQHDRGMRVSDDGSDEEGVLTEALLEEVARQIHISSRGLNRYQFLFDDKKQAKVVAVLFNELGLGTIAYQHKHFVEVLLDKIKIPHDTFAVALSAPQQFLVLLLALQIKVVRDYHYGGWMIPWDYLPGFENRIVDLEYRLSSFKDEKLMRFDKSAHYLLPLLYGLQLIQPDFKVYHSKTQQVGFTVLGLRNKTRTYLREGLAELKRLFPVKRMVGNWHDLRQYVKASAFRMVTLSYVNALGDEMSVSLSALNINFDDHKLTGLKADTKELVEIYFPDLSAAGLSVKTLTYPELRSGLRNPRIRAEANAQFMVKMYEAGRQEEVAETHGLSGKKDRSEQDLQMAARARDFQEGGVDLSDVSSTVRVVTSPSGGVVMNVDQALVTQLLAQDIEGLRPRMLFSYALPSVRGVLGLTTP